MSERCSCRIVGILVSLLIVASAVPAAASPWTVDKDQASFGLTYNFSQAGKEFLPKGKYEGLQQFPLDGEFSSSRLAIQTRYGFSDKVEGGVELTFKQVSYQSTPFFKGKPSTFGSREALYGGNDGVFDFSDTRIGAGDFHLFGRYNFWSKGNLLKLTTDTDLKLPTGYDEPSGTFAGDQPNPAGIEDDVALGDGQVDITQSLLFGAYIVPTNSFFRADAGYQFRFGPPGDQVVGGLKIGQNIGKSFILFAGSSAEFTVTDGEAIGTSFIATEPGAEPYELKGGKGGNIKQIPISLDKDFVQFTAGAIFQLSDAELQFSYSQILWGRNIPALKTASVSTVFALPNVTGDGDSG